MCTLKKIANFSDSSVRHRYKIGLIKNTQRLLKLRNSCKLKSIHKQKKNSV